jgi:ATP phosphoribosyltransferase regulatory subunit
MPERWRRRLRHQFWRPVAFRNLLETFAKPTRGQRSSISKNIDALEGRDAVEETAELLTKQNLTLVTQRSVEDIAARLAEKLADRSEQPLGHAMVQTIENYLQISGSLTDVTMQLNAVSSSKNFVAAVAKFEQRIAALEDQGLNPRRFHFSADFGRELEYYTGLVFQIDVEARNAPLAVAGGGRYDRLLQDLGAPSSIAAVGCAIHTDRLLAVMS